MKAAHTELRKGFFIHLYLMDEPNAPDWDFESPEDKAKTLEAIDSGALLYFCAKVTASRAGIVLGTDYLGGCCYDSLAEFLTSGYYEDMVHEAIVCAQTALQELCRPCGEG